MVCGSICSPFLFISDHNWISGLFPRPGPSSIDGLVMTFCCQLKEVHSIILHLHCNKQVWTEGWFKPRWCGGFYSWTFLENKAIKWGHLLVNLTTKLGPPQTLRHTEIMWSCCQVVPWCKHEVSKPSGLKYCLYMPGSRKFNAIYNYSSPSAPLQSVCECVCVFAAVCKGIKEYSCSLDAQRQATNERVEIFPVGTY